MIGTDYYETNEHLVRSDGTMVPSGEIFGYYVLARQYQERYGLPLMHTETNMSEPRSVDWLRKEWANMVRLKQDGIPIVGFTWYSLTDQVDWCTVLARGCRAGQLPGPVRSRPQDPPGRASLPLAAAPVAGFPVRQPRGAGRCLLSAASRPRVARGAEAVLPMAASTESKPSTARADRLAWARGQGTRLGVEDGLDQRAGGVAAAAHLVGDEGGRPSGARAHSPSRARTPAIRSSRRRRSSAAGRHRGQEAAGRVGWAAAHADGV